MYAFPVVWGDIIYVLFIFVYSLVKITDMYVLFMYVYLLVKLA